MVSQDSTATVSCVPFGQRIVRSVSGACFGALLASLGLAGILFESKGVPWLATAGLFSAVGVVVACALGVWVAAVDPGSGLPRLRGLFASKQRRWRTALSGPAICIAWVLVGQLSLRLLTAFPERPKTGGVLTAASALGVLTVFAFGVDRLASLLAQKIRPPSTRLALGLALGIPAVLVPFSILSGATSGAGSFWALFGTLRRPELDLSPVWQLGVLAGCAVLGIYGVRRLPSVTNAGLLLLALLVGSLTLRSASALPFRDAVELERTGGLAALSLGQLRSLTDADGDGYSPLFGGGDCNDDAAQVHPGAVDIPENGVDEDCRGGDRKRLETPEKEAAPALSVARLPEEPNVLLLTIDTLRWDLGFSGAESRDRLSPHLDDFAARSTVFERAYSLASYTSKSLGPMLIGKYPSETKRTFEHFDRFAKEDPFLQERIQATGIRTISVQGYWYFHFKGYGFERGWDELDSSATPRVIAIEGDTTSNGDEVRERTIEHLNALSKSGEQFFLWSHWVDPHAEYVPHAEFDFGADSRERYDGEVAFVDEQVGKVLAALQSQGLDKNTIVIVTSDHGEAFGEHGLIRHGFEVWEELVRVPLLVHVPGAEPKRVPARRSLIDLAPTVLEALSVPLPEGSDERFRGTSLLRDVLAARGSAPEERPVLVDMPEGPNNRERRAFYEGDLKLITSAGRVLGLYNLAQDPGETKDLSDDPALVEKIRGSMDEFLDGLVPSRATR